MKFETIQRVTSYSSTVDSLKESVSYLKEFMQNCQNVGEFIKSIFTDPVGLLYKGLENLSIGFQSWGPDVMLVSLFVLVILYFLGFKNCKKWIKCILIIGLLLTIF